jgi:multidrug efflux pump subunit AcrB
VATTLLTIAVTLAGVISYKQLPVSPLPRLYDIASSIFAQKLAQVQSTTIEQQQSALRLMTPNEPCSSR